MLVGLQLKSATEYLQFWGLGSITGRQSASMGEIDTSKEVLLLLPDTHKYDLELL